MSASPSSTAAAPVYTGPLPPGPSAPAILQTFRYVFRPLTSGEAYARRFGDCFTLRMLGNRPIVVFTDPEAIKDIFSGDPEVFSLGEATTDLLEPILGRYSILVLDGARHLRQRRLMLPPFHGERMKAYGQLMREVTERTVDAWPVGRPFPIHREMQAITLEIIMRAVFGLEEGAAFDRLRRHLVRITELQNSAAAVVLAIPALRFDLGRLSPWGRFVRDREAFRAILLVEIARRRTEGAAGRDDILAMLVEARDEEGAPMSDEELLDEMLTLLTAGHETTAGQLAWTFYHVLRRPDVVEKLRAELDVAFGSEAIEPTAIGRLEYLDAVVKESQRISPVAPRVGRRLRHPARIGGRDLPAGVGVSPDVYLTHHRPDLWPEPDRFLPERFLGAHPSPYAFFPFGGGIRRCLGAAFATYEMKIVLAEVVRHTDLRLMPGYRMRPVLRVVTVGPSRGMPVVLDARKPALSRDAAARVGAVGAEI